MNRLFLIFLAIPVLALCVETDSEKTFREAIPGHYVRQEGSIASLHLDLIRDGTYVFQLAGDMGVVEAKRGKWRMKDDVVELDGAGIYGLRRFRVYSSARIKKLSLLPLDDEKVREKDADEERLFLRRAGES